jgi:hypothetical protein
MDRWKGGEASLKPTSEVLKHIEKDLLIIRGEPDVRPDRLLFIVDSGSTAYDSVQINLPYRKGKPKWEQSMAGNG